MNVISCYCIYLFYKTLDLKYLLIIIISRMFSTLYIRNIPLYITTEYLYNDYFEKILCKNDKCLNYYTEGTYDGLVPFNVLDKTDKNVFKTQKWAIVV